VTDDEVSVISERLDAIIELLQSVVGLLAMRD
jgi:hypothetical protein